MLHPAMQLWDMFMQRSPPGPGFSAAHGMAVGEDGQWTHSACNGNMAWVQALREHADKPDFQRDWQVVKQTAKEAAMRRIASLTGTSVSPDALLDIQVKRIHEYKRQLLNVLGIVHRYDAIRNMSSEERQQVGFRHPTELTCRTACSYRSPSQCCARQYCSRLSGAPGDAGDAWSHSLTC